MTLKLLIKLLLFSIVVNLYGVEKEIPAKSKIAIVVQNAKGEPLADSIMASLSEQNIICLERTQIKKVIDEQKLSSSGLIAPASIIKCSRLLKVDTFVVIICSSKTKMPIGVVAFDTKLGIRLIDISLPKDFEKQIKLATAKIISAISKAQLLNDNKLKLISFLPLNQIALQGKDAESARLVELLLMQLIGQNQDVFVLERSQLDFLLKERSMDLAVKNQLLAGSLFIQLETELTGKKTKPLAIKFFAKDISGKVYFSLKESYAIGNETKVAVKISIQVSKKLGLTVLSNSFDCIAEAKKYLMDCRLAQANGMYNRASRMARNAYVLNPGLKKELIEIESQIVKAYLSHPGSSPVLKDLKAAVGHIEFIFDINCNSMKLIKRIMHSLTRMSTYYFDKKVPAQLKARITKLRERAALILLRKYTHKYEQNNSVASAGDMKNIARRINEINDISRLTWNSDISIKYGLPLKKLYVANVDRFHTPEIFSLYKGFELFASRRGAHSASSLNKLYRSMQKTSNPYFKIIGTLHLHTVNYPKSYKDPSYVDFLVEVIDKYQISDYEWRALRIFLNRSGDNFIRMSKYGIKLCYSIYKKKAYDHSLFFKINYRGKSDAIKGYTFMREIQADTRKNKNMTAAAKKKVFDGTERHIKNLVIQYNISTSKSPSLDVKKSQVYKRCFNIVPAGQILSQPLYNGKYIYVARIGGGKRFLYRISPQYGFRNKAGKKISIKVRQREKAYFEKYLACLSKKKYIMATSAGLFIFPLKLSTPKFVPLKEFKGFSCYSLAYLKGKVYMSYNKNINSLKTPLFLVEYDLRKKSYSVIYASHQNENNPFSKYDLNKFRQIYADSIRNRLVVAVWKAQQVELWALNPVSRIWKKLSDLPYYPKNAKQTYNSFIIRKNKTQLFIIGSNVAYEFNATNNQYKLLFYSGATNNIKYNRNPDSIMKACFKWKILRPGWSRPSIRLLDCDGNKLLSSYRLIFLKEKKALNLIDNINHNGFIYAYFALKHGNFVIGSNHNVIPNDSLMVQELKSDNKLLNLQECYNIAP